MAQRLLNCGRSPCAQREIRDAWSDFGASQALTDVFSLSPTPCSAFHHPAPKPACLPGLVHSQQGQRSGLRSLDPVVYFIYPLCLSLLVQTHLQGFQASSVCSCRGESVFRVGGALALSLPILFCPEGFFPALCLAEQIRPACS